jgi:hypothetical protein
LAVFVFLQIEQVTSQARGGSHRGSNLTMAGVACNSDKGARPVGEFLAGKPVVRARIKAPLKDAAAVNATRWAFYETLADTCLPAEAWSSRHTKSNRARVGMPKTHMLDAACVGEVGTLPGRLLPSMEIKASARGHRCRTQHTARGLARGYCMRTISDIVRAAAPKGPQAALHLGRVAVPASGSFTAGNADGTNATSTKLLDHADGYGCAFRRALPPPAEAGVLQRGRLG